ncbi:hypothetical protein AB0O91_07530 [Kitasatospora sp. NPDC089797]|uniref:hypothetical protein n=1 Tax=Kitasatospora sp. NPDC089797 TaxID=3155298 RepID=UPI003416B12B
MKRSTTAGLVIALAAALAACGAEDTRPAPPQLGEISTVTAIGQVVRPIDVYLPTSAQSAVVQRAVYAASAHCLRQLGISEAPWPDPGPDAAADQDVRSQLYGYFSPGRVATTGYDAVTAADDRPAPSAATQQVLAGRDGSGAPLTEYQGRPVPEGGCLRAALDAVGGSMATTPDPAALPGGGPKEPLTDPRIVAADRQWSGCMKSRGFSYATPADAFMDPRWRDRRPAPGAAVTHSPVELATATADDACKRSTNLMGIAVAVQTAYDKQYIAAHADDLAAFTRRVRQHIADCEKLIATDGAG